MRLGLELAVQISLLKEQGHMRPVQNRFYERRSGTPYDSQRHLTNNEKRKLIKTRLGALAIPAELSRIAMS